MATRRLGRVGNPEDYSRGKTQGTDAILQPKIATDDDDGGDVDHDDGDDGLK